MIFLNSMGMDKSYLILLFFSSFLNFVNFENTITKNNKKIKCNLYLIIQRLHVIRVITCEINHMC